MPADFTLKTYHQLLDAMVDSGYSFQTYIDFIRKPLPRVVVLRHDIDARSRHALDFAKIQHNRGICGTYYFRIVPGSWDEQIIRAIHAMGHEIGYHYEDMAKVSRKVKGNETEVAHAGFLHFKKHLEKLRNIAPVETICSHGSPLSPWDNKSLWKHYDYKSVGIEAEPYFDTDFSHIGYLTDTGRCWNGDKIVIRDRPGNTDHLKFNHIRNTYDLIEAFRKRTLPEQLLLTIHPQRWHTRPWPWIKELLLQRIKNSAKIILQFTGYHNR
jgi:hypothetical protein